MRSHRTTSLDELTLIPIKYSLTGDSESSDIGDFSSDTSASDSDAFEFDSSSESGDDSKSKHKKSSSFSSSPFLLNPSWKQHRKTHSQDSNKRSSIIPKYNHLQSNHRRQNSDDRTLQKTKFKSNYASLQKELYSRSSDFAPYEVDLSDLKQVSEFPVEKEEEISPVDKTKQSLSTFLVWTIGSLFLILLWAIFSWQAELFSISI